MYGVVKIWPRKIQGLRRSLRAPPQVIEGGVLAR
jgi:hypothetical protein